MNSARRALAKSGTNIRWGGLGCSCCSSSSQRCSLVLRSRPWAGHSTSFTVSLTELTLCTGAYRRCWIRFWPFTSREVKLYCYSIRTHPVQLRISDIVATVKEGPRMGVIVRCPHTFGHPQRYITQGNTDFSSSACTVAECLFWEWCWTFELGVNLHFVKVTNIYVICHFKQRFVI